MQPADGEPPDGGWPSVRFHINPRLAAGAAAAARGMLSVVTCPQSQGASLSGVIQLSRGGPNTRFWLNGCFQTAVVTVGAGIELPAPLIVNDFVFAIDLEREKVDLIYSLGTSVTLVVKRATKTVPIVFNAGSDPVAFGLVESFRKPGGRLTGIYSRFTDLTAGGITGYLPGASTAGVLGVDAADLTFTSNSVSGNFGASGPGGSVLARATSFVSMFNSQRRASRNPLRYSCWAALS